jgi:hypothetical protein
MAQKPDGKPARTERVTFTKPAAERIAKVVRAVEGGDRDAGPLTFGTRNAGGGGKVFRVCTFTGSWAIGSTTSVKFKHQTATPNTVAAVNIFCGLSVANVTCDISIAKEGTTWYLVQADLTRQPGFSNSGTHVLTVQNGVIKWIGTTAC